VSAPSERDGADCAPTDAHREALLKEYGEVAASFRLLTDIRFKLLAFLPIAAGAATGILSAGGGSDGAAEARALALSTFGLVITLALATYNDRNDQLYDTLVGRAASIEWQLGLSDGAFANRPTAWFAIRLPLVRPSWSINHRAPVAWIYGSSAALWIFSTCAAAVQLGWGDDPAPRGVLAAAIVPGVVVPLIVLPWIRTQRKRRQRQMRADAAKATRRVVGRRLPEVAADDEFLRICQRLGGVSADDARARAQFYSRLTKDERRRFMPDAPDDLIAAHFVALVSDLPAEWIDDCARERRKRSPKIRDERVLLIGKRAAVLTRLQAAVRDIGIEADLTRNVSGADPGELRQYAAVAFGRAVGQTDRARIKEAVTAANPDVAYVDGLAPIAPLLVAQLEEALDCRPENERKIGTLVATGGRMELELRAPTHVLVTAYRLTRLHRRRTTRLLDEWLEPGGRTIELPERLARATEAFAVVRTDAREVRVVALSV
jgi:hypothetical protein